MSEKGTKLLQYRNASAHYSVDSMNWEERFKTTGGSNSNEECAGQDLGGKRPRYDVLRTIKGEREGGARES